MNKIIIVMILLTNLATARMSSEPPSQRYNILTKQDMQLYTLKPVDVPLLLQKNAPKDYAAKPLTFAVGNSTDINLKSHGSWTDVPGGQIWNLRFESKNATDINFGFTKFNLPVGVELYLISFADDPVYYDGPYTSEDNQSYKQFWSAPLPGGDVALELFVPNGVTEQIELGLTKVSTGFRDIFKRYDGNGLLSKSAHGSCNNDVVCPEGNAWSNEIRSVAAYTLNGIDTCTGTMVMDAANSFTPYFLTADHCGITAGNAATMVTIWNYESANCGDLSGGVRIDTVSGAIFRATRSDVDVSLVELSSIPPDAFDVYWSGWDGSGTTPTGSVGIHHPRVREKSISFNTDALTTIDSCIGTGIDSHWRVDNWEDGTTEPGSSGSGLWDPATNMLVGFLSGGTASCSSITMDCYGKVSEAWDDGSGAASNLKTWLDPNNTGATSVAGSEPTFLLTATDTTIEVCSGDNGAGSTVNVVLYDTFNGAVALAATTAPAFITGFNFGTNPIDPTPGSSTFIFNVGAGGTTGDNALVIQGSGDDNGTPITADVSINILYSAGPTAATTLATPADGAVDVVLSTTFSWAADANATSYHLMVSDDPGFGTLLISEFVTDTSFDAVGLPGATQLYWKVATISSCGPSHVESSVFTFTTEEVFCVSTPNAIPDNSPGAGVDITLPVTLTGSLASLTASVKSDHTWPGDLIFTLSHAGTSVVLMDRPGVPTTLVGCSQDGVDAVFDDASATPVETECAATSPGIGGTLAPEEPLSAFAGAELSGDWVLNVTDNALFDTGSITEFCVVPAMLSDLIFANGFEAP